MPDAFASSTAVQLIKRQISISAPSGMTVGQKWDCHIFTAPLLTSQVARPYDTNTVYWRQMSTNTGGLGTVNVVKAIDTGTTPFNLLPTGLSPGANWPAPPGWTSGCYSPTDNGNAFGSMRLVGGGLEVHNTTAELYRQGNVVVYSQPNSVSVGKGLIQTSFVTAPTVNNAEGMVYQARLPPASLAEVLLNTNAKDWEAAHGVYLPFRLQPQNAHFSQAVSAPVILTSSDQSLDLADFTYCWGTQTACNTAGSAATANPFGNSVRMQELHTTGCYFSGLGPETTLTLTLRFFVEIAPTPSNPTLLSLASPSPPYDPVAMELYSRAVAELLPGCMVGENANGEWWETVKRVIANVTPAVAAMGPYGALAGAAMGAGTGAIDSAIKRKQAKKEAEKALVPVLQKKASAPASGPKSYSKK